MAKDKRVPNCSRGKGKGTKGVCPPKAESPKHKPTDFRRSAMSEFKAKPKRAKAPAGKKR